MTAKIQSKLATDNPDIDFKFARASMADRKIHDKIMDAIIKRYRPNKKEQRRFTEGEIGDDIGLEKMAHNLNELSNGRLSELK